MIALLAAGGALLADQWSKRLALLHASEPVVSRTHVLRILPSVHRRPMFQSSGVRVLLALTWLVALVAALLLRRQGWFPTDAAEAGLGLAFGGAAGNLLDVIRRHSIVDFIDIAGWTVFNVADATIVSGLLIAFLSGSPTGMLDPVGR